MTDCLPDCPLCLIDRVPVVPGKDLPLRRSLPPYGVKGATYYTGGLVDRADSVNTMPEFATEHRIRNRRRGARVFLVVLMALAAILATAMIALADPPVPANEPQEPQQPVMSPVVTLPPPLPPSD